MNIPAANLVQWLFLDINAFFASCEQQEIPALRGKPIIVVQTLTDSACAIAASYPAKRLGITTRTLVREARRICADVIPVQARHRLYTDYHERILQAVDTCLPVEKVMSIDEMACRLMGTERQVPVARKLAAKVKRALREQVGECLTCSIGLAPNVFLGKVGSDIQKPDGLTVITHENLPGVLLGLELQCQTACNRDPPSASKRDPLRWSAGKPQGVGSGAGDLPDLAGDQARFLKRQLSLPVSTISQ